MVYGGGVRRPQDVVLFNAVMYNWSFIDDPVSLVENFFGEVFDRTETIDFSHTDYYEKEFGGDLKKIFLAHRVTYQPDKLVEFKLRALEIEDRFKCEGKRKLNLDPGYVAIEKVVAASTKNFTHRIYMGKGIYGDLQLQRRGKRYEPLPWTFHDYALNATLSFFDRVREKIMDGGL
ncbi:MAG: DUF4416 family protein [Calditerrivibrio sp.]|nr:DUF4416 family protein [Calditerrivibrio sp.]MCA1980797.1 DUF4416 family protein [Calditerrivibrio sp.]